MKTRLLSLMLALVAVLLPSRMWAEDTPQGYAELAVNNGKAWGTDDATYTLTFKYGVMPSNTEDTHYWDAENTPCGSSAEEMRGIDTWFSYKFDVDGGEDYSQSLYAITRVIFEPSFANARPKSIGDWFDGRKKENGIISANSQIESIEGLEYLNTSETTTMRAAFYGCKKLASIDVSHFDTSKVTDMQAMFNSCENLTSIDVSGWNTGNVQNMSQLFIYCSSLTSLDLSSFDTKNVTTMLNMFKGCSSLQSVNLSSFDTSSLTTMTMAFQDCSSLTELDLSSFNIKSGTTYRETFTNCSQLKTIYANASWPSIGNRVFEGCVNLVGGNGTEYEDGKYYGGYARIDATDTPGYFTLKVNAPETTLDETQPIASKLARWDGTEGMTVTIARTFAAGTWESVVLPFDVDNATLKEKFGDGVQLKTLAGAGHSIGAISATFTTATAIEAGKPYFIKVGSDVETPVFTGVTISKTLQPVTVNDVTLTPTWNPIRSLASTGEEDGYLFTAANGDYSSLAVNNGTTSLGGMRAYFTSTNKETVKVSIGQYGSVTYCSDYDLDFTGLEVKAYAVPAFKPAPDAVVTAVRLRYTIPAQTGLILTGEANTEYEVPVSASNVIVANLLEGTTSEKTIYKYDDGYYYMGYVPRTEVFNYVKTKANGGNTMKANTAYLKLPAANIAGEDDANAKVRLVFDDEEATDINSVDVSQPVGNDRGIYYNLSGQRVSAPAKGIYIKDGKKVLVK